MKSLSLVFILILSSFAFAQTKDDDELKALVTVMVNAQVDYRVDVLDKIFTADYIEISPAGEFDSRDKVLSFYKPELKPPAEKISTKVEATDFLVRNYGKFAIVITQLNFTITSEGKTMPPRSIRATIVFRKIKGFWKIASAQYTGIRPPQPTKTQ